MLSLHMLRSSESHTAQVGGKGKNKGPTTCAQRRVLPTRGHRTNRVANRNKMFFL